MSWIVVASLEALRAEFNSVFPNRDKTSDGGIGDQAHATGSSGHNPDETGQPEDYDADSIDEVRARDFDADLRHPTVDMERVCQYLVGECRAGRMTWIKYLIFNRRIWRASAGWKQEAYTGASPHTEHLHVSCKPDTASENNTRPVGLATLVEVDMDQNELLIGNQAYPNRTKGDAYADLMNFIDSAFWANPQYARRGPEANSWFAQLGTMAKAFPAMQQQLQAVAAGQTALATNLAALPGAVAAELEDEGGVDGTVVQAAVERALAKLRLTVNPT